MLQKEKGFIDELKNIIIEPILIEHNKNNL